jgi:hypothetical protein
MNPIGALQISAIRNLIVYSICAFNKTIRSGYLRDPTAMSERTLSQVALVIDFERSLYDSTSFSRKKRIRTRLSSFKSAISPFFAVQAPFKSKNFDTQKEISREKAKNPAKSQPQTEQAPPGTAGPTKQPQACCRE